MQLVHDLKLAAMRVLEKAPDSIGSVSSVNTTERIIVPTFDDGPTPTRTEAVLRALADHDATGTFFVLLTSVRANPGLLQEVVAAGHEIGLHGMDHRHLPTLSRDEAGDVIRRGKAELEDALGMPVQWFRPPHGDQSVETWRLIREAGMTSVIWSGTSHDWNPDATQDQRVEKATANLDPGTILLFHDGHAGPADLGDPVPEPALDRYELLDRVLRIAEARGLRAVSLSRALENGTPVMRPHFNLHPRHLASAVRRG
ncbi:polysaccharide deacetylase family protein [Mobilicoccus pelagius]|uniref:Putative hydrolase n=1 Tax=Mobilicoccus pelagius NBRC 104925 TaxID=1089455 RepID=H5UV77_9MICO|nr:polysaccharide deacetylase family protein [Mobilicoccus pelagius]GAB49635.1 putative hydrolase [Mobilicoccus pelagius NBRC 104925]